MNSDRPSSQSPAAPERKTSGSETTVPKGEVPHVNTAPFARLANWMAPALILLTPLVGFLVYHHYDVLRAETLSCAGLFILIGLAISAFIELRPGLLRPAVIALLLILFLDLHLRSAEQAWLAQFVRWDLAWAHKLMVLTAGLLIIALVLMTVTWMIRQHLGTIVSSIFGVVVLTSLLLPFERPQIGETYSKDTVKQADLPPVLHLVLDGQISLDGLPNDIPGAHDLRRELTAFYRGFGFTVFGSSFSHYRSTAESLSNLLNGQAASRARVNIATSGTRFAQRGIRLRDNLWFRQLSDRGYRIWVYQTDYIDFCAPEQFNVDYCFTAPSNSIRSVMDTDLSLSTKIRIILNTYLSGSMAFRIVAKAAAAKTAGFDFLGKPMRWLWRTRKLGAFSAASVLDRIARDLRAAPQGTAFFAHVMIPHGSYVLDADCGIRSEIDTWLGSLSSKPPFVNTPASRATRYKLYFDQVRCTHRKLASIFRTMAAAGIFEKATIIVHGDHGSRIALTVPTFQMTHTVSTTDLTDSYATLFAMRAPEPPARSDHRLQSIQGLFAEFVLKQPLVAETTDIFILPPGFPKAGSALMRIPMPEFGD